MMIVIANINDQGGDEAANLENKGGVVIWNIFIDMFQESKIHKNAAISVFLIHYIVAI